MIWLRPVAGLGTAPIAQPRYGDGQAKEQAEPSYGAMDEDEGAIEGHEEEEGVPCAVEPAWARGETRRRKPPPKDIGEPSECEDVVEVEAAAPVKAGQGCGLACGFAVGGFVAPMMEVGEGAEHVDQEECASDGPYPAGGVLQ